ncbi:hypothetical protein CDL15_Pgr012895 [Punica granatum]|uniref:Secreted protein n=1 Tax=Punica granatum TaxID=22663 RepID=A0A218XEP3_PUNGR|nr:hypothetical protein CDL15_Pgr012895 [Punica granatum]
MRSRRGWLYVATITLMRSMATSVGVDDLICGGGSRGPDLPSFLIRNLLLLLPFQPSPPPSPSHPHCHLSPRLISTTVTSISTTNTAISIMAITIPVIVVTFSTINRGEAISLLAHPSVSWHLCTGASNEITSSLWKLRCLPTASSIDHQ